MPAPKKYPDELRERAVRLVLESGRPIAHIAKDLGIHREALRQWVVKAGRNVDHLRRLKSVPPLVVEDRRESDRRRGGRARRARL